MTKQICLTLYLGNCTSYNCGFWYTRVKCHRVYFETFLRDGTQYIDKVSIGQFYPEILFQQNCGIWAQFGPKSYSLMIHSQLCLMIHSLEIFKYGMIGCYSYTKEAIIFSLWARAIWAEFGPNLGQNYATLCVMIHFLKIFLMFCTMIRRNVGRQKKPQSFFRSLESFYHDVV